MAPTKDRVIPGHRMSIRAGGDGSSAQRWIDQQKTLPIARAARRFAGEEN